MLRLQPINFKDLKVQTPLVLIKWPIYEINDKTFIWINLLNQKHAVIKPKQHNIILKCIFIKPDDL